MVKTGGCHVAGVYTLDTATGKWQIHSGISTGNENIVGERVHGDNNEKDDEPENTTHGNHVKSDDSKAGGFTGIFRTVTFTVLGVVLAVSVVAALAVLLVWGPPMMMTHFKLRRIDDW